MKNWSPTDLTNVYSQFGEDAILQCAIKTISEVEPLHQYCVEFGAWDGLNFSNTANLIKNFEWSAVLIESDKTRFGDLLANFPEDRVTKVNDFVHFEGDSALENILHKFKVPLNFDLLSIDIDGGDFWIFKSISKFKPKIIVIEFNPTISNKIYFVNERDILVNQGSSLRALVELGIEKGYFPFATTVCNLILIDTKYASYFPEHPKTLDDLHTEEYKTDIWIGFDGAVFLSNDLPFLWHSFSINQDQLQVIPKYLRLFPENYTKLQTLAWIVYKKYLAWVGRL